MIRRRLFSETPEEKETRRAAVGALGGVATASGAIAGGYIGKGKKGRQELKDLKEKVSGAEKGFKEAQGKLSEIEGKINDLNFKKGKKGLKPDAIKSIENRIDELTKELPSKSTVLTKEKAMKVVREELAAKKKALGKRTKIGAAIGAGVGLGATIAGNELLKHNNRRK